MKMTPISRRRRRHRRRRHHRQVTMTATQAKQLLPAELAPWLHPVGVRQLPE